MKIGVWSSERSRPGFALWPVWGGLGGGRTKTSVGNKGGVGRRSGPRGRAWGEGRRVPRVTAITKMAPKKGKDPPRPKAPIGCHNPAGKNRSDRGGPILFTGAGRAPRGAGAKVTAKRADGRNQRGCRTARLSFGFGLSPPKSRKIARSGGFFFVCVFHRSSAAEETKTGSPRVVSGRGARALGRRRVPFTGPYW